MTIEGIVTGIDDEIGSSPGSGNAITTFPADAGIHVQEEPADIDDELATSEGIFVGLGRVRRSYPPGTRVRLNGTVRDGAGAPSFRLTRIEETVDQEPQILDGGALSPLPAAMTIDPVAARGQDHQLVTHTSTTTTSTASAPPTAPAPATTTRPSSPCRFPPDPLWCPRRRRLPSCSSPGWRPGPGPVGWAETPGRRRLRTALGSGSMSFRTESSVHIRHDPLRSGS